MMKDNGKEPLSSIQLICMSHHSGSHSQHLLRRSFLGRTSFGLGGLSASLLLGQSAASATVNKEQILHQALRYAPKAKRVIFLCMAGGPSHLETFDEKPELTRLTGKPMPESFTAGQPIAQLQGQQLKCQGPMTKFRRYGKSGQLISDYLPYTAQIADDICIVKSMHTDQINHDPAHTVMNTGVSISGRPSMGSWVTYGLGSESEDLPGFVVLSSVGGRNPQPIASRQWHSGFLPAKYQGVEFYSKGDPVHYVRSPNGTNINQQKQLVDTINQLNQIRNQTVSNPDLLSRIAQYELAFRMQTSVPELMDLTSEPEHVLESYGTRGADGSYAANCLLARRLIERGVRFVQLYHRGWDHHGDLQRYMNVCCKLCDQPSAALVKDLKQRGLLDETLVIWSGEFGRTPMFQGKGKNPGRDHHIKGFSLWMAGGGIKGGTTYGNTDELGYNAVENPVHINDLHATMLHLLGIDHQRLTVRHQGRDFRLTDVAGKVLKEVIS